MRCGGRALPHLSGMSTQPNIPDADRITILTSNNSVRPFAISFVIFEPSRADLVVELNGVEPVGNWALSTRQFPDY